jgi:hypothetical protein
MLTAPSTRCGHVSEPRMPSQIVESVGNRATTQKLTSGGDDINRRRCGGVQVQQCVSVPREDQGTARAMEVKRDQHTRQDLRVRFVGSQSHQGAENCPARRQRMAYWTKSRWPSRVTGYARGMRRRPRKYLGCGSVVVATPPAHLPRATTAGVVFTPTPSARPWRSRTRPGTRDRRGSALSW